MALAAVSSVINSTLVPLLSSEVNLLGNINREVASIKAELESIMSFLKDVDSTPIKNERAKNWVKQVRELAYQIEDVMDEYVLHLAENRQRRGFIGFLRKLARSITKLKPQHDIATQIQGIKQNIRDIKERADRYAFDSLEPASSSKTEEKLHDDPRVASLFIEEDEVVGIESTREELIHRLITGKSNRTVTSLVGMGGCGKTTLAKKVFDNRKVIEHFDCQAWVSVSQSYKMEDIFRRMIKELFQTTNECAPAGIDTMDQNSLIHMLREFLLKKRYLIVFDDVWSADFWRLVKLALPKNNKGSQIIVTTRKEDVASFCKESSWDHICKVKPLIKEEAWKLFCMKAFQRDFDGCCPPELETVSRAILKKCEGTLAIVIIGALLSTKSKDASEWQKFYDSLGSQMERNQHLTNVTKILLLSYHDLPYYLKPCFLYFGIIPEDYQITRGRLIRLWIAEGFIEGQKGKTLEEVAEEWLTELIHRSLVQVSEKKLDGRIKSCRVHDLVHEIILVKCEELGFCQVLREAYPSWDNETRRWSMQMRNVTEKGWWETMSSTKSKIRSVFVFSVGEFPKLQFLGTLAGNFKLVKVLDLQGAPLYQLHEEVGNLLHLRYLSVKRTKVKIIPKSIGNLHNLQTLNLACSRVSVLQIGILSRLRKLRHLIGNYMMEIQGGIGHLEELQTLKIIMANDDLIKELENLRQLRKLDIRDVKREHVKALCTAIEKMNHLQSLAVESIRGNTILDLHSLSSPPKSLQRLNLFVRLEMLPNWISRLDNLVSLHLYSGLTGAHAIKALQVLPNLIQLYFSHGYDGEQLYFDVGGFPKLKLLYLQCSGRLNSVIIEEGGLPVLEDLRIEGFPQLKEVPSSIRNLTKLKSLIFVGLMPTEFYDRMRPDKGQDYWVIEHIPNVKFYWNDGRGNLPMYYTPREFQDVRERLRVNDESQEVGGVE